MADQSDRIDLHCHTTASDGELTPTELVQLAERTGLRAVAITDHDTVAGIEEARLAARALQVEILPGVEITAMADGWIPHLLGYFVDTEAPSLQEALSWMREARDTRNPRIAQRLQELGVQLTLEEVEEIAGRGVVGRPHFARALMQMGVVETVQQAFDEYLGVKGKAYIPRARMEIGKAIGAIRGAGGVPVLAHPVTLAKDGLDLDTFIPLLKEHRLEGLEVWYSEHDADDTARYLELAKRFDLVATGGSDFHGSPKPEIHLGSGINNNLSLSYDIVEELRARRP